MGKNQAHAARKTNFSSGDGDGGGADFGDGMVRSGLRGRRLQQEGSSGFLPCLGRKGDPHGGLPAWGGAAC